jgi:hypothetical protein
MNDDICQIITSLIEIEPEYRLLDWIDINYVYWKYLSSNYYGIHLLIKHQDKIDWDELSENEHPEALKLLKQNPHLINWSNLSSNPSDEAIELLIKNPHLIEDMIKQKIKEVVYGVEVGIKDVNPQITDAVTQLHNEKVEKKEPLTLEKEPVLTKDLETPKKTTTKKSRTKKEITG